MTRPHVEPTTHLTRTLCTVSAGMGLLDSLRRMFSSPAMRDRHADREAGSDPKLRTETPSGNVGPGGSEIDKAQSPGGAIEPDPPPDRG